MTCKNPNDSCAVLILAGLMLCGAPPLAAQEQEQPLWPVLGPADAPTPLPGTAPLVGDEDLSAAVVAGADRFLTAEVDASVEKRARHWKRDFSSAAAYEKSVAANREKFRDRIGLRDPRREPVRLELLTEESSSLPLARAGNVTIYEVQWDAFGDVHGEGLLLVPDGDPVADVVAVPDADVLPEVVAGLGRDEAATSAYGLKLAAMGCRVLIPALIQRAPIPENISHREWVYRPAFELGRHIIGYEVHKILAGIDYFAKSRKDDRPVGVIGWGEGALLALYAAAADTRIDAVCVSGYFGPRQDVWREPAYRNVFGLLDEFGDAEIASLIAPRGLLVDSSRGPDIVVPAAEIDELGKPATRGYPKGKPGRIATPGASEVQAEIDRAHQLTGSLKPRWEISQVNSEESGCSSSALTKFAGMLGIDRIRDPAKVELLRAGLDRDARHQRQVEEIVAHTERLLRESPYVRDEFMKDLDIESLEAFEKTIERYRHIFREEVIGHFDLPLLDPGARTRKYQQGEGVTNYEVVLDVFPEVIAYGILTLPDDLEPGEKRPVVVCQHGLEGRPHQVIGEEKFSAYKAFATRLAQRGFITFAPQNLYRGNDDFRLLQFKAQSIGKTLFSVMVPQHQQIVNWLSSLEFVDPDRIAFYGLSYGGKSAMRIPPLVPGYALSICSADFNEWVWKNCSTLGKYSYVDKREYEIFEWDLGSTFNYAEMAALIAPRPFMVERGHHDGVAPDEQVAFEFAKVRRLYDLLGIGDRAEIEWFTGPHTINGVGTFEFLHRNLLWPEERN